MGAFDTIDDSARCPRCELIERISIQNKFFDPDYEGEFGSRWFRRGSKYPIAYSASAILDARVWDSEWWRVRDRAPGNELALLVDPMNWFGCACGASFAPTARFAIEPRADGTATATFLGLDLLDAHRDGTPAAIDFASYEGVVEWHGKLPDLARELTELAESPRGVRFARLRTALANHFAGSGDVSAEKYYWDARTPVACEACGRVRELNVLAFFSYPHAVEPVLGAGRVAGTLTPGLRIECDTAWTEANADHSTLVRLRPPGGRSELRVLTRRHSFGCGCGAGMATLLTRFRVEPGALEFLGATLRVVRTEQDVADVDFAEAPTLSATSQHMLPAHYWRPSTRDELLREVMKSLRTA